MLQHVSPWKLATNVIKEKTPEVRAKGPGPVGGARQRQRNGPVDPKNNGEQRLNWHSNLRTSRLRFSDDPKS